jgi:membrane protein DedA with SNARE-associated domain
VFLGRWVAGLRVAAAWLAGINAMAWPTFVVWNALGGIAWACSVGLLSSYLGSAVEHILKVTGLAGIAAGTALLVAYLLWRGRRGGRGLRRPPRGPRSPIRDRPLEPRTP